MSAITDSYPRAQFWNQAPVVLAVASLSQYSNEYSPFEVRPVVVIWMINTVITTMTIVMGKD
jgi:hypothetical protein